MPIFLCSRFPFIQQAGSEIPGLFLAAAVPRINFGAILRLPREPGGPEWQVLQKNSVGFLMAVTSS